MWLNLTLVLSVFVLAVSSVDIKCAPRDYGQGSTVCVCNSTYCDTVVPVLQDQISGGAARHYVSTKAGKRLEPMSMKFSKTFNKKGGSTSYTVNRQKKYQEILGFGGASTDAATINTYALSSSAADNLIRSYFAQDGIGYSFIRVPLGGTDFSTHKYAYLDNYPNDTSLKFFNLSSEDFNYKIPFIKRAKELSPEPVKLFTAAWSPPDWMKNIDTNTQASSLKPEYYQAYADYMIKFLDAYGAEGLRFWGLTPQNEPRHGRSDGSFNSMGWYAPQMMQFVAANLCPTLKSKGYEGMNVMITDNQRIDVFEWIVLFENETINECATGMSMHWYTDKITSPHILNNAHKAYPDKFLLYTEACTGTTSENALVFGSWERGQEYMTDIIEVTNHWVSGWVDWNMVLDVNGGPSWINSPVDAAVIVNSTADEFYKQPMFYALAHFAKFVPPGSVHIKLESSTNTALENVAFLTPDNTTVVILHNNATKDVEAVINDPDKGSLTVNIPATSFNTILYK